MSNLDLRLLKIFVTIVECKGISPAQAELNLSLSSISSYLSTLEVRLGTRLCTRGRRGFKLTDEGRIIYSQALHVFSATEAFSSVVSGLKGRLSGTLKIGMADCMATDSVFPLPKAIARFKQRDNDVEFALSTHSPDEMMRATINGQLDLSIGLFGNKIDGLQFQPLYLEAQSIYCHESHPLFSRRSISREELNQYQVSNIGHLKLFDMELIGAELAADTMEYIEAQAVMILSGAYLGVLPQHYARKWVNKGEMRPILPGEMDFSVVISLASRKHGPHTPAETAFIQDLRAVCQELVDAGEMRTGDPLTLNSPAVLRDGDPP